MKHIFIINPDAGKGKAESEFLPKILKAVKEANVDYEIHRAMSLESGSRFVRSRCEGGESVRFYACGGDGTLNGVLNGVMGFSNAQIACIPAGTGNDFVRSFRHARHFLNIQRQIQGKAVPIDVLKYNDQYAINMLNIGIDCSVVSQASVFKRYPFMGGSSAYVGGIAKVLLKGAHFPMILEFEGGQSIESDFLLTAVANGRFCGGGFEGAPKARLTDGFFDVCIVGQMRRRRMIPMLLKYKTGTHLEDEECRKYIRYKQCKKMVMIPNGETERMKVSVDGEVNSYGTLTIEIAPGAVNFVIPEGCTLE